VCKALCAAAKVHRSKNSSESVNDPRFIDVVRRHLQPYPVAYRQTDEALAHPSGNVSQHDVLTGKLDAKHGSREHGADCAFQHDSFFDFQNCCSLSRRPDKPKRRP